MARGTEHGTPPPGSPDEQPEGAYRDRVAEARRRSRNLLIIVAVCGLAAGAVLILRGVWMSGPALTNAAAPGPAGRSALGTTPAPSTGPSSGPSSGAPALPSTRPSTVPAATYTYSFPVGGKVSYGHTHHDYPATDILTACGNPVYAATSGVILETTLKDTWSAKTDLGADRGGLSVSILGDDGVRYYGSHLKSIENTIKPGVRVTAGQQLGKIGETGDASACHLHFGISPPCARVDDWYNQRGVLYPWPYLDAWRAHDRTKSPVSAIAAWRARNGCPTHPLTDP
jgi:murein DD-endopeptidase MepM/ murein hydrolase activator NlpD